MRPTHEPPQFRPSKPHSPRSGLFCRLLLACALLATAGAAAAAPENRALLIGISKYQLSEQARRTPGGTGIDLDGPAHDVAALRDVLIRRWGFRSASIVTLVDAAATRRRILDALQALDRDSNAGDSLFIYFSGHGSSALDAANAFALPLDSGAFVPYDFSPRQGTRGLVVGRTDLRPAILALERKQRKVWVVADSCYSGAMVRGLGGTPPALPGRYLPVLPDSTRQNMQLATTPSYAPEPYPYVGTVFLSASALGEVAGDVSADLLKRYPTRDGKPHGVLSDALLRILEGELAADEDASGQISLDEVHRTVTAYLSARGVAQSPQRLPAIAEDNLGLGRQAVLAAQGVAATPRHEAAQPLALFAGDGLPTALAAGLAGIGGLRVTRDASSAELLLSARGKQMELRTSSQDLITQTNAATPGAVLASLRQFAWAKRLRQTAERHRRAALATEITPNLFGGNFRYGQKIAFVVRPERAAYLLLLNLDASGRVTVLYPNTPGELAPLPGGAARHIPGQNPQDLIRVQAPEGLDLQFVFAFDTAPPDFERLIGLRDADAGDPRLIALEALLPQRAGQYSFGTTELRSLPGN